ncbi:hypothetical protein CSUB01_11367, partial [Colletotrichum sublineola]
LVRKPVSIPPRNPGILLTSIQGHPDYYVDVHKEEDGHTWAFKLFSKAHLPVDDDDEPIPMDYLKVNTNTKRLAVIWAYNGYDVTPSRLKMRQILAGCWKITGLEPADLREVKGLSVSNENMKIAIKKCRRDMGLEGRAEFSVVATDEDDGKKRCWESLGQTIFFSSIKGAIRELGIDKKVVEFKVKRGKSRDDNMYLLLADK